MRKRIAIFAIFVAIIGLFAWLIPPSKTVKADNSLWRFNINPGNTANVAPYGSGFEELTAYGGGNGNLPIVDANEINSYDAAYTPGNPLSTFNFGFIPTRMPLNGIAGDAIAGKISGSRLFVQCR